MKACREHQQELAASAALSSAPSEQTQDHLRRCVGCREALAALQSAARVQIQAGEQLPGFRCRPQLGAWFRASLRDGRAVEAAGRRSGALRRVVLCGAAACVLVLGLWRIELGRAPSLQPGILSKRASVSDPAPASSAGVAWTWQALRSEVNGPGDGPSSGGLGRVGTGVTHYRVRDVRAYARWAND